MTFLEQYLEAAGKATPGDWAQNIGIGSEKVPWDKSKSRGFQTIGASNIRVYVNDGDDEFPFWFEDQKYIAMANPQTAKWLGEIIKNFNRAASCSCMSFYFGNGKCGVCEARWMLKQGPQPTERR